MTLLSRTWRVSCRSTRGAWQNATYEEQKMTTNKLNRSDDWNDLGDLDFEDNSNAYSDSKETAMEDLSVHLGNEQYFEGYPK
jgi:hypothetical protein